MSVCVFFSGTVAHKIMQKYGFREGQGLGKHEQGLSTALSVEKTSKRGGKIIIGDSTEKSEITSTHTHTHTHQHTATMYKLSHQGFLFFFCSFLLFRVSCLFSIPCVVICATMYPLCECIIWFIHICLCLFQHQHPVRICLIHMALIQVWFYFISCFPYQSLTYKSLHLYVSWPPTWTHLWYIFHKETEFVPIMPVM